MMRNWKSIGVKLVLLLVIFSFTTIAFTRISNPQLSPSTREVDFKKKLNSEIAFAEKNKEYLSASISLLASTKTVCNFHFVQFRNRDRFKIVNQHPRSTSISKRNRLLQTGIDPFHHLL